MQISPPKIVVYGHTVAEAYDVICKHRLENCQPFDVPFLGLLIRNEMYLTIFALRFRAVLDFEGKLAIVPPHLIPEVEEYIQQVSMERRVRRYDLTAVEFWDIDDEKVFAAEWGLA